MKKISKILTFILVLAMVLGTVAMADGVEYTITAGTFTNGSISLTLVGNDGKDTSLGSITVTNGKIENIEKDSKVKVVFVPNPGYEFLRASDNTGKTIKDGDVLTITDNLTITVKVDKKRDFGFSPTNLRQNTQINKMLIIINQRSDNHTNTSAPATSKHPL